MGRWVWGLGGRFFVLWACVLGSFWYGWPGLLLDVHNAFAKQHFIRGGFPHHSPHTHDPATRIHGSWLRIFAKFTSQRSRLAVTSSN